MNLSLLAKSSKSLFRLFFVIIFFLFSFEISFADGGTVTYVDSNGQNPRSSPAYSGGYTIETFTSSGTFTTPVGVTSAEVLIVAGGGGGTVYYSSSYTGGGGAGGLLYGTLTGLSGSYAVTVGSGGASSNGGNSSFGSHTALGGGYATGLYQGGAASGGSGGGSCCASSYSGTAGAAATQGNSSPLTGYGNAGGAGHAVDGVGAWGGGGGGAGGAGGNAGYPYAGTGGAGRSYSITGTSVTYAAGGYTGSGAGAANTGNGGGAGQNGGSGIVIIKYLSIDPNLPIVSSATSTYITTNTATLGANIESIGGSSITDRGICYGFSASSTTCTPEGSTGVGTFSLQVSSLATSTTYYYYAYAVNSYGTSTSNGSYFTTEGITNSLIFDSSISQYLNRTFSTPTDNKNFTFSFWVKRSKLGANQAIISKYAGANPQGGVWFDTSDRLQIWQWNGSSYDYNYISNELFRDPSAWMNIVIKYDIDGSLISAWVNNRAITWSTQSNPSPSLASAINGAYAHTIGNKDSPADYFDGYLSDVNFIDGQALTPSSFGKSDSNTGNWIPKAYQGTYGTNGFHLNFSSSTALGTDTSGNGNTWTTNGGITSANNQVIDTPLNNFATLNILDKNFSSYSNIKKGNLYFADGSSSGGLDVIKANIAMSTGKWYWEVTINNVGSVPNASVGLSKIQEAGRSSGGGLGSVSGEIGYVPSGNKSIDSVTTSYGATFTTGDIIGVAYDGDTGNLTFYKNNVSQGTITYATSSIVTPAIGKVDSYGAVQTINFGQKSFTYNPPSGFKALSTANLPTPTILKPNQHFDVATRTGTAAGYTKSGLMFQPDLIWSKGRNGATNHYLQDITRGFGASKSLSSNTTGYEGYNGGAPSLHSFSPTEDGYTLNANDGDNNTNSTTYVDWLWKAGSATTTNASGTITSTVSVNQTAGFSIIRYTGNGSSATVGHGLNATPTLIISKNINTTADWPIWHANMNSGSLPANNASMYLSTTGSYGAGSGLWSTTFNSSVIGLNAGTDPVHVNYSGRPYLAYVFTEVHGYSKFGSYTGNASTDGPFIYTGFKPKFVMVKKASGTGDWVILDTGRDTYNEMTNYVSPNLSNAETSGQKMDMLTNGFKIRVGASTAMNDSSATYIYAAFAELPMIPTVPSLPTLSSPTATSTTESTAILGGTLDTIGSTNVTVRGVCYGSTPAPTTNCTAGTGTSTGVFTVSITGLATSTTYYYRAYATNSVGTAYSSDSTFTTEGVYYSLILDSSQSQYLSRTPSVSGNQQKWTWSGWVKRGALGSGDRTLFSGGTDSNGNSGIVEIGMNNDSLYTYFHASAGPTSFSTAVFRDPTTWYHVVASVDTTQASNSDRLKIYINGQQVSMSQTIDQNYSYELNGSGYPMTIGRASWSGSYFHDGYLSDINFIDGQALTPSSFGKTDSNTGNWIPKKYTGTYGNNGFRLQFNNSSALGADTSGNNNHWSLNGGITQANNQVIDTPLNNFTILTPLMKGSNVTLASGNLKQTGANSASTYQTSFAPFVMKTGKWYWEATQQNAYWGYIGSIIEYSRITSSSDFPGYYSDGYTVDSYDGKTWNNNSTSATYSAMPTGGTRMIAYDADTGKLWIGQNGTWFNSGLPANGTGEVFSNIPAGDKVPTFMVYAGTGAVNVNFGQGGQSGLTYYSGAGGKFKYEPPTGFKALSTANLPIPSILKPNQHFDVVTYTGTGASQSISSLNFKPGLVWIKDRNTSASSNILDTVRGERKHLESDTTNAETTESSGAGITSFDSNGFSLGTDNAGAGRVNYNTNTFVAWNWKAGNATTTNTSGSITSTVSANPTAGFSIAKFVLNVANGVSISWGHGLSTSPKMVIYKRINSADSWLVYHPSTDTSPNNYYLTLQTSNAKSNVNDWASSTNTTMTGINNWQNGDTIVAYSFAEVPGYSKFGSYTGNGSADGPFVYTGFKPRYIMTKRIDGGAEHWNIFDTSRAGYNSVNYLLYANLANADDTTTGRIDILSNGFKARDTGSGYNASGATYVYVAFAELPMIPTISSLPTVSSPTATSITESTVVLGGTVDSLGGNESITARGTCFATTPNPTINCLPEGATTTGIFTQTRTGLASSTLYYYRAYVTNQQGTFYSSDSTFVTDGIKNSLLFDSSQGQYLSRTFSTPTDGKKYTFSTWVKRSKLGYEWDMFTSGSGAGTDSIYFSSSDDAIIIRDASSGLLKRTAQVFRDPSKWYHIVLAVDTTQSTADNRNRLYIDGVENTSWVTNTTNSTQDAANNFNSAQIHRLGAYASGGYGEGYQSDTNFVDGQQLTPSSFGQADSNTGNWIPKSYTGSYGTNGFRLKFNNANSLGQDTSGNNNNWSLNGGITQANNQVTDTPLNNFATLNPLDKAASNITLSKGNLKAAFSTNYVAARSTMFVSSGSWYLECTAEDVTDNGYCGIATSTEPLSSGAGAVGTTAGWGIRWDVNSHETYHNGTYASAYSGTPADGDVYMMAFNMDTGKIWWGRNGTWFASGDPSAGTNPAYTDVSGLVSPMIGGGVSGSLGINFGQKAFAYTPPTGYKALSTANLPVPNILKPNQHFDTVTYTGNSSSKSISTLNFKPDLVWIKGRSYGSSNHIWNDAVRGPNKTIFSNQSLAEYTDRGVESFDINGFSMSGTEGGDANADTQTYVAWNWKGGNATTTNTSGSITSTVSANPTAGFSIINYTGTGSNGTVGHGLGSIPNFIIFKQRSGGASSGVQDWGTYHSAIGPTGAVRLNLTNANVTSSTYFNNATPTATVINLGSFQNYNELNGNFIAYAFSEVPGYSKFGSYTGNGSADGPFVYTGFKPRYIMIKQTTPNATSWWIKDTARATYDPRDYVIQADSANAESTNNLDMDILSNGFKPRLNWAGNNTSGSTYIYVAFAESTIFPTAIPISTTTIMLTNVNLTPGDTQVNIGYSVPESPNFSEVIVLRSSSEQVTDTPVDGTSYSAGNTIGSATVACVDSSVTSSTFDSCISSGLTNNTTYYFKVFTKNSNNIYTAVPLSYSSSTPGVSSVDLSLSSYRIREDNGDEFSATYTHSENTPITNNFIVGDKKRIRFVVSNQTASLITKRYQLEYSTAPCTSWTILPKATESTNQHFRIEPSYFLNDGSATSHSSGLSIPSGKTFTPGRIQSSNNLTDPITLRSNEYTEIEYSIRSTSHITPNTEYCFRLTGSGDSAGFTYTNIPQFTSKISAFRPQSGGGGGSRYIAPIVGQAITAAVEESATTTAPVVSGGGQSGGGIVATNTEQIATTTAPQQSTSTNTKVKDSGGDSGNLQIKNEFALIKDTINFLSLFIKELANYQLKSTAINAYAYQECNLKGLIFIKTGECEHLDMYGDNKSKLNLNILWSVFNKIEEIGK